MDLLTTYILHWELRLITAPLLISTIDRLPQHPLSPFPACCVFSSRSLAAASNSGNSSASRTLVVTVRRISRQLNSKVNFSASYLQDNSLERTTQKTQPIYCCRGVFTGPWYSNGRGANNIEITILLLRALLINGRCLPSHCLATGTPQYSNHCSSRF
jgi:hypothetical protein